MTPRRLGAAILVAAALAAAAGWAALPQREARATAAGADLAVVRTALAHRPVSGVEARLVPGARAIRAWVRQRTRRLPLPSGGNFNGIRWERLAGQLALADVDAILQYNARCQWQRAARDGREAATAVRVLEVMEDWAVLRAAQGPGLALGPHPIVACDESHAREVSYARSLGLQPSR